MATVPQKIAAALVITGAALALAAPSALASRPPRPGGQRMHWYRWHPSRRTLQGREANTGGAEVLGVTSMRQLAALQRRFGFSVVQEFPQLRAAEVVVSRSLLGAAARDPRIRYLSSLGTERRPLGMPNDPLLSTTDPGTNLPYEWQFAASHVEPALEVAPSGSGVVVGTIDTGVADVPDLVGKIDQQWTVSPKGKLTRDLVPGDLSGHGTAVASLIAANVDDGFGMAGFGGNAHVIAIRVWKFTDVATATALMKLDRLGVRIVNMSFGGDAREGPIMLDAIHKAAADGMLLIAAAGNFIASADISAHAVAHPAADLEPVGRRRSYGLAVGASDVGGHLAFFSDSGAGLSLLAPGGRSGVCTGVLVAVAPFGNELGGTCYPNWYGSGGASYAYVEGTSFAAPEVAGVAALIWAARPELANYQVADIIKRSARRGGGWTPTEGCGVLDAAAALDLATSRSGTVDGGGASCTVIG